MLKYFRLIGLALLFSVGVGSVGKAASFDCNKATTETEIAICGDPELSAFEVLASEDSIAIESCRTSINGKSSYLDYDINGSTNGPNPWLYDNYTFREILFAGWSGSVGCPSSITLAYLAPEFSPKEREEFCLYWDKSNETYTGFSKGKRSSFGRCKNPKTVCQRVGDAAKIGKNFKNSAVGTIAGIIGKSATSVATASSVASAAGVSAVTHSSGAAILTGSSGYVAGSMGTLGANAVMAAGTVSSVVTAPTTLVIGGIIVAGIGAATYLCWDTIKEN